MRPGTESPRERECPQVARPGAPQGWRHAIQSGSTDARCLSRQSALRMAGLESANRLRSACRCSPMARARSQGGGHSQIVGIRGGRYRAAGSLLWPYTTERRESDSKGLTMAHPTYPIRPKLKSSALSHDPPGRFLATPQRMLDWLVIATMPSCRQKPPGTAWTSGRRLI